MENISTRNTMQWKVSLTFIVLTTISFFYVNSDILTSLIHWWRTTSKYAHSLIIFPAIIYLIFEHRKDLVKSPIVPDPLALLPLTATTFLISLFYYIDVQIVTETLFIAVVPLIIWALMGRTVVLKIVMPLALLITVAPIWELFSPILTIFTAEVAYLSLKILGIPVFKDEMYLTIPEGVFVIAEGCGGFRYFITGFSLGLIFAHLNYNSFKQRTLIVLLALGLSIVANWIRVMIVIWAGHVTDMQHPYVKAHVNLGWYVFAITFFLYFFICNRYIPSKSVQKKLEHHNDDQTDASNIKIKTIGVLVFLALILPNFIVNHLSSDQNIALPEFEFSSVAEWNKPNFNSSNWKPSFIGAEQQQIVTYRKEGFSVDIFYALYTKQSQGKELINYENSITNSNWQEFKAVDSFLTSSDGTQKSLKRLRAKTPEGTRTIWSWYNISGIETSNKQLAKVLELYKILSSNKVSMVIAASTLNENLSAEDQTLLANLLSEIYPKIVEHFNTAMP